jgi:dihydroorotase
MPICSITDGSEGDELAPLARLASLGCRAFSNDGRPVVGSEIMLQAMRKVKELGGVIIDHCEDPALAGTGVMHQCSRAREWELPGINPLAEEVHIARDILLAAESGCPVHIAHISTARGVDLIRWAKSQGYPVTAEACPHHFILTVDDMPGPDPDFKMNPPLRGQSDREAVRRGLADGSIDVIATDHAPHTPDEKSQGFQQAPFGIIGLESAIPLIMDQLYHQNLMTIAQIVEAASIRPARIMGAAQRSFKRGLPANVTIIDPLKETTILRENTASKSQNTPFHGWSVKGSVKGTIIGSEMYPAVL